MAKFDVYVTTRGGLVLDCQADVLSGLNSRFVVPLSDDAGDETIRGRPDRRLNPRFQIDGRSYTMFTHLAAAIPTMELRSRRASLAAHDYEVGAALDMLISGF
ncbi:CcdB family protein [Sphingomonas sp. RHCKR7]|uniref:CcdB family protein n=1 Tax=Sphingomonas folli TaxID=2862497 RepID=UPI001C671059|nr:CcdB family protein [Sphingomonas folli]MBW6527477.1 CcdB family protein [Sphingomonas folli]